MDFYYGPSNRYRRHGIALLLVLAILAVTVSLVYGLSRSSMTVYKLSATQGDGLQASAASELAASQQALDNLAANQGWMPSTSPIIGTLPTGETYSVAVQSTNANTGLSIGSTAQVLDPANKQAKAQDLLSINLTRTPSDNHPTAAIAAFATDISATDGAPVYVANGSTIRGNVRSKGPIQFQKGFVLQGTPYVMGNDLLNGTGLGGYTTYYTKWLSGYQGEPLAKSGKYDSNNRLNLNSVTLGPSSTNPMGVFYHGTSDVIIGNSVTITGSVVVEKNLTIQGTGIKLFAVTSAVDPTTNTTFTTSFPAVVTQRSVYFDEGADAVRISGLVVAGQNIVRKTSNTKPSKDGYNHTLTIDASPDPFTTNDGPAIYIKGGLQANRVTLKDRSQRPFALVFNAATTDVSDAPGFSTWRVADWKESN